MRSGTECRGSKGGMEEEGSVESHGHSLFVFVLRFVSVDLDEAMQRVEKRHVATGKPPHIAKWRVRFLPPQLKSSTCIPHVQILVIHELELKHASTGKEKTTNWLLGACCD